MAADSKPSLLALRLPPPPMTRRLIGVGAMAFIVLLWWLATRGFGAEDRLVSPVILPSPLEVIRSFPSLLHDRALVQSIAATLKRVLIGFGLAAWSACRSGSRLDPGASSKPPARRSRSSAATCPWPRSFR